MIEKTVPRHYSAGRMLKLREAHETDHPAVFKVYGRNMEQEPYTLAVLWNPLKVLCNCEAGRRETACWHAVLVLTYITRRLGGSTDAGRVGRPAQEAAQATSLARTQQRSRLRVLDSAADGSC